MFRLFFLIEGYHFTNTSDHLIDILLCEKLIDLKTNSRLQDALCVRTKPSLIRDPGNIKGEMRIFVRGSF